MRKKVDKRSKKLIKLSQDANNCVECRLKLSWWGHYISVTSLGVGERSRELFEEHKNYFKHQIIKCSTSTSMPPEHQPRWLWCEGREPDKSCTFDIFGGFYPTCFDPTPCKEIIQYAQNWHGRTLNEINDHLQMWLKTILYLLLISTRNIFKVRGYSMNRLSLWIE